MHVAEILDREGRIVIMLRGAWRQHARAEATRLLDQGGFLITKAKRIGREDRRVTVVRIESQMVHARSVSGRPRENMAEEVEDRTIENGRRFQVRHVAET